MKNADVELYRKDEDYTVEVKDIYNQIYSGEECCVEVRGRKYTYLLFVQISQ